ncbi:MAG TPA: long-chain fatty acid--CoA ligase [Thermoleophilaceae bacterium]|nr:long-chain fatty acid--CoA ligase [Thermoleophilaceae bacterium]
MESSTVERKTERPPALDAATMCEAFQITSDAVAGEVALRTKDDEVSLTWREYADRTRRVAAGLAALGVRRADTVALMLTNRPEFHFCDAGAMHLGATPFSIYNTYTPEQIEYLVGDAGNTVAITEQAFADRLIAVKDADNALEHVVVVDGESPAGAISLAELEDKGDKGFDFEAAWKAVQPEDILTLIYTSGTTGPPKGVQITHGNMTSCVRSYDKIIGFPFGGRIVSYLPMAHVAERNVSHYLPMLCGFNVTSCPDARQVAEYLPEVKPSWFFAVPRIWEKMKAGLEAMLAGLPEGEQKQGMQRALDVSLQRVKLIQAGEEVPEELEQQWQQLDDQVLSNVRDMLGLGEVEACNVGAAPTPPEVIEFFHALGVPLAELWGMSETTGAGTCNPPDRIKIGTVGPPAPDCEVKLDEDGEVLIRGGVVMPGYRNLPDKTAETFTDDGFLRTGDIGEFDADGYLKIVDRKKELIISAAGKNMSPANIESKVKAAGPLIGQVVTIGDARQYNSALVTLDPDAIPSLAEKVSASPDPAELAGNEKVIAAVQEEIDAANEQLARVEQIKKFTILPTDWQPGGDELTPTMKLKRKPIAEKYRAEIEELYS